MYWASLACPKNSWSNFRTKCQAQGKLEFNPRVMKCIPLKKSREKTNFLESVIGADVNGVHSLCSAPVQKRQMIMIIKALSFKQRNNFNSRLLDDLIRKRLLIATKNL
jgi:hypothetical protein